jgi:glycosyltransferase involved in cell wall biosynthesis
MSPLVSIIFGTYNRLSCLKRAVASIRTSVAPHSYEIVITDGGSTDGSLEWMQVQPDIVIADRDNLRGAVSAFNAAWAASKGDFIANFNDDAEYLDDALAKAVDVARSDPKIGQVALTFDTGGQWHIPTFYNSDLHCANFGVSPRSVVEAVCAKQGGPRNYWNPIYHTYAGDCEHSVWIWNMQLRVQDLTDAHVHDVRTYDDLRKRNTRIMRIRGDDVIFDRRWPDAETIRSGKPSIRRT